MKTREERRKEIEDWVGSTKTLEEIKVVSLSDGEIELESIAGVICLYLNQDLNEGVGFNLGDEG